MLHHFSSHQFPGKDSPQTSGMANFQELSALYEDIWLTQPQFSEEAHVQNMRENMHRQYIF